MNTRIGSPRLFRNTLSKLLSMSAIGVSFVACGGGGGGSGSIAGQVSAPRGSSLSGTVIAAILCKNDCKTEADVTKTIGGRASLTATGSNANYEITAVAAGKYLVLAVQDTNGDGAIGTGDLIGAASAAVSPPTSNANIGMQPYTAAAGARLNAAAMSVLKLEESQPNLR